MVVLLYIIIIYLVIPVEVRSDSEANTQDSSSDWLDAGLHHDGGDLMGALFDR